MRQAAPAEKMPAFPMRIYVSVLGTVRSNRMVFRKLFGFIPPPDIDGSLWDWTTLVLRKALRLCFRPASRLLDMGTGPVAVLGIYARNTLHYEYVCAVDHVPEITLSARRSTEFAHADVNVFESSLFESVTGKYEVIAFNAPYIDASSGTRLGVLTSSQEQLRWCGGKDGLETVGRFLADANEFLTADGLVLLGMNHFYVRHKAIEERVKHYRWSIVWTIQNRWTQATVYALQPTEKRMAE